MTVGSALPAGSGNMNDDAPAAIGCESVADSDVAAGFAPEFESVAKKQMSQPGALDPSEDYHLSPPLPRPPSPPPPPAIFVFSGDSSAFQFPIKYGGKGDLELLTAAREVANSGQRDRPRIQYEQWQGRIPGPYPGATPSCPSLEKVLQWSQRPVQCVNRGKYAPSAGSALPAGSGNISDGDAPAACDGDSLADSGSATRFVPEFEAVAQKIGTFWSQRMSQPGALDPSEDYHLSPPPPSSPPPPANFVFSGDSSALQFPIKYDVKDDVELFSAAREVVNIGPCNETGREYNTSNSKIAFLFHTRGPLPLSPLWEKFFSGHSGQFNVYIHANPDYDYREGELTKSFRGRRIPGGFQSWGNINLVWGAKRLLAHALMDPDNFYFVHLSEYCIPIRSFAALHNYLKSAPLSHVLSRPFMEDVHLAPWGARVGEPWFELHRPLAAQIALDKEHYDVFMDKCPQADVSSSGQRGCGAQFPDRTYFSTLAAGLCPSGANSRSLTYSSFPDGILHAHRFTEEEVTAELIDGLRSTMECWKKWYLFGLEVENATDPCFYFARRFHPNSLPKLLELSSSIFI